MSKLGKITQIQNLERDMIFLHDNLVIGNDNLTKYDNAVIFELEVALKKLRDAKRYIMKEDYDQ